MTPDDLTNSELVELIETLSHPTYRNLSKFHAQYLADLQAEASRRKLKL